MSSRPLAAPLARPSRRALVALCFGAHVTWATGPSAAQDLVRQRAIVDSVARELARAEAALEALGRAPTGERDTLRVGALVVVAPRERAALATQAMEEAWPVLAERLGPAADAFARDTFELRLIQPGVPMLRDAWEVLAINAEATPAAVATRLLQLATRSLMNADDLLRAWFGPDMPFAHEERVLRERAYLALVTSLSVAAERCFLGDLAWCREATGIAQTDDPIRRWYDASGRQAIVAQRSQRFHPSWTAGLYDQCSKDGSDVACTMLLDALPERVVRQLFPPLPTEARQLLLLMAVARGGSQAIERLHATSGPIQARLVAVSGEPIDSLLSRWRGAMMAAAPPAPIVTPGARWLALAWVALFIGIGLTMRVTRWS